MLNITDLTDENRIDRLLEKNFVLVVSLFMVLIAAAVGCSDEPETLPDIDATVEARVAQSLATQEALTIPSPSATLTPPPSPTLTPPPTATTTLTPAPSPTLTPTVTPTPDIQTMISAVLTAIPPTETPTPDFQATAIAIATITAPTHTPTPLPPPSPTPTALPNFAAIAAALRPNPSPSGTVRPVSLGPMSTPVPAPRNGDLVEPSGNLNIAVDKIGAPSGLPRFCSAVAGGCSEIVYVSGMTETLFNSALDENGSITTEPMLATDFALDPSLEYGDFTLRKGVMFHNGYGEMTSEDVAFSYNDANSVTNPESTHGQAVGFAPLIASMDPIDPHTVRLQYRNYDSRGILHRFSRFWETAGIVSSKVFAEKGVEGMQDDYTGVGAFRVDEWVQQKHMKLTAFPDYYARGEGNIGPFVERVTWLETPPASESARALLSTGRVEIAEVELTILPELLIEGFEAQQRGLHNTMVNIAIGAGNYWEEFGALTGDPLERNRDGAGTAEFPHVGNPFEDGGYSEDTNSMQSARLVRNALAWSIDRDALVQEVARGLGIANHQPYLSVTNPNYRDEWSWGTDFAYAKYALAELGYPDGFEIDMWIGTDELNAAVGQAVGAGWQENLNVRVNLVTTEFGSFRPSLTSRTNKIPFVGCGDENHSNFPFDWAHGFAMSSISAGGYGVGMEIPWAAQSYLEMAGEPDKSKREEIARSFFSANREWAMCVGLFEYPNWPVFNPDVIEDWDQRPTALTNLGGINNIRTIGLR